MKFKNNFKIFLIQICFYKAEEYLEEKNEIYQRNIK